MDASQFRAVFLAFFGSGLMVECILNLLNRREILRHASLPARFTDPPFAGRFDADTFARSRAYALERLSFDGFSLLYSAVVTFVLLFSGLLPWFDRLLARTFTGELHRGALFLAGILAVQVLIKLPLTLHATFRIEGKYGFNTMTWGLFWRDLIKESLLSALLGLPLVYAVLALMRFFGVRWWAWAFGLLLAFQFTMMIAYPVFIAPLFNRFRPLEEGEIKSALLALAGRLRFPAGGVYVMDGSRRSLHSNAYFTGFGRFRRIVLFDTLLRQMDRPELLSVLAHEIGHYKRKHIYKMMAAQTVLQGGLLFLASLALRWPPLYAAFGFTTLPSKGFLAPEPFAGNPAAGLFLFMTAFSSLSLLLSPLQNLFSRRHEYEADAYAVQVLQDRTAMQTALIKLSHKNLSNLTPHPWYSAFHYSHPSLAERIGAIERLRVSASGGANP
ncbi:MAG TPA: M48 family metallopeptidase [Fibrobacteria bacterium]|nr:M48 family metallopeptidase [Fibrobacteria bacterium]